MSVIVSDTSPLNYLVQIGEEELLPKLFSSVIVPPEVITELLHPKAPAMVRDWAEKLPAWIAMQAATKNLNLPVDMGELAALSLAVEIGVKEVLIDEAAGRNIAVGLGLKPLGTLGVIEMAAKGRLIDLEAVLSKLERSTFRAHPDLFRKIRKS